jgi:hypothetical protein
VADSPDMTPPAPPMSEVELAAERRRGRFAGAAAIGAGLFFPAGVIWSQIATNDIPDNPTAAELRFYDRHVGEILASSALRSIASLLLIVVAVHLYRATKARKPELNPVVLFVGIYGPVALAIGGVLSDIFFANAAADFTSRHPQTERLADDLAHGPIRTLSVGLVISGTAALAFWFVMGSLNAMRVGLLTRFMGMLGIVIGPALLIIAPAPIVMGVWSIAVGLLFLRLWPSGPPPAWIAGRAVPWPSTRPPPPEQAEQASESRNGEVEPVGPGVRTAAAEVEEPNAAAVQAPRKKRKRR